MCKKVLKMIKYVMLTSLRKQDYSRNTTAQSVVGIDTLLFRSAKALTRSAFFAPTIYGGLCRSAFERADLRTGIVNLVQSATLLVDNKGGGFPFFVRRHNYV